MPCYLICQSMSCRGTDFFMEKSKLGHKYVYQNLLFHFVSATLKGDEQATFLNSEIM